LEPYSLLSPRLLELNPSFDISRPRISQRRATLTPVLFTQNRYVTRVACFSACASSAVPCHDPLCLRRCPRRPFANRNYFLDFDQQPSRGTRTIIISCAHRNCATRSRPCATLLPGTQRLHMTTAMFRRASFNSWHLSTNMSLDAPRLHLIRGARALAHWSQIRPGQALMLFLNQPKIPLPPVRPSIMDTTVNNATKLLPEDKIWSTRKRHGWRRHPRTTSEATSF
jgi:hypothetical protein